MSIDNISVVIENAPTNYLGEYNLGDKKEWSIGYSRHVEQRPDIILSNMWKGLCGKFSETDGVWFFISDALAEIIYMRCHIYNGQKRYEYPRMLHGTDVILLHDGDVFIFRRGERIIIKSSDSDIIDEEDIEHLNIELMAQIPN